MSPLLFFMKNFSINLFYIMLWAKFLVGDMKMHHAQVFIFINMKFMFMNIIIFHKKISE